MFLNSRKWLPSKRSIRPWLLIATLTVASSCGLRTGLQPDTFERGGVWVKTPLVFSQGTTSWCWAYSAFHSLKGYFGQLPKSRDPDVEQARDAVDSIKTNLQLKALLLRYRDTSKKGWPHEFVPILEDRFGLKSVVGWGSIQGSTDQILRTTVFNISKGIPSAYCTKDHCMERSLPNSRLSDYASGDASLDQTTHGPLHTLCVPSVIF